MTSSTRVSLAQEDGAPFMGTANGEASRAKVSIVAPCFNEEQVLPEFVRRATKAAEAAAHGGFEIVLVDDGSSDRTWQIIEALSLADPRIVGVKLMRNHGHQLAVTAGLQVASGARVLLIDADLQDPPELLADMMQQMDEGADVVSGVRQERTGETALKRATASVFYRILSRLTDTKIPLDTGDFRLMSRRVGDIMNAMPERHRFIRGMVSWIGGRQVPIHYNRDQRFAGETKYPISKMIRFASDAITSFSTVPLRTAVWLGLIAATFAIFLILFAVVQWARGAVVPGWTSVTGAVALFSGVQLVVTGIMGEYLGRLVEQSKNRPLVLIDKVCGGDDRHVTLPHAGNLRQKCPRARDRHERHHANRKSRDPPRSPRPAACAARVLRARRLVQHRPRHRRVLCSDHHVRHPAAPVERLELQPWGPQQLLAEPLRDVFDAIVVGPHGRQLLAVRGGDARLPGRLQSYPARPGPFRSGARGEADLRRGDVRDRICAQQALCLPVKRRHRPRTDRYPRRPDVIRQRHHRSASTER